MLRINAFYLDFISWTKKLYSTHINYAHAYSLMKASPTIQFHYYAIKIPALKRKIVIYSNIQIFEFTVDHRSYTQSL